MPLSGVRVLDASSGVAGPLAAMLLADFGAEVVKVEPPGGDPGRGEPGFAVWNRNKRSVVLDTATEAGRARLSGLLAGADVCVCGAVPPDAAGTPLDPAAVSAANPALVYLSTPPYTGAGTPWAGGEESNGLLAALTGVALRQSSFDGGPIDCVYPFLPCLQGIWAAAAAVAALLERERSGRGQVVTVGGVHGMMVASPGVLVIDPAQPGRPAAVGPGGPNPCYRPYRCGDGR